MLVCVFTKEVTKNPEAIEESCSDDLNAEVAEVRRVNNLLFLPCVRLRAQRSETVFAFRRLREIEITVTTMS